MSNTYVGIALAKNVFAIHGVDEQGTPARLMGWTPPRISVSKYQPATRGAGVGT